MFVNVGVEVVVPALPALFSTPMCVGVAFEEFGGDLGPVGLAKFADQVTKEGVLLS